MTSSMILVLESALGLSIGWPQDTESFEQTVLEHLVGKEGEHYPHGRPDIQKLIRLGDRAIPILLKHASDDERSYRYVCRTLYNIALFRKTLPTDAAAWIKAQVQREDLNWFAMVTVGYIGDDSTIPRLLELAKRADERTAKTAIMALGIMGGERIRGELERLGPVCKNKEAAVFCSQVLAEIIYPFAGDGGEARLLAAIEADETKTFRVIIEKVSTTMRLDEIVLPRLVFAGRKELVLALRDIVSRCYAKDSKALENWKVRTILVTVHRLGGAVSEVEKKALREHGSIDQ